MFLGASEPSLVTQVLRAMFFFRWTLKVFRLTPSRRVGFDGDWMLGPGPKGVISEALQ